MRLSLPEDPPKVGISTVHLDEKQELDEKQKSNRPERSNSDLPQVPVRLSRQHDLFPGA